MAFSVEVNWAHLGTLSPAHHHCPCSSYLPTSLQCVCMCLPTATMYLACFPLDDLGRWVGFVLSFLEQTW